MSALTQYNPLKQLEDVTNRLSAFFGRGQVQKSDEDLWITQANWAPVVDIMESDQEYVMQAELPGMEKDRVKVTVENGLLLIAGERCEEKKPNHKVHRVERTYGSFLRSFSLPADADETKIEAHFKNGLLSIHLPKREDAKPQHVEVKVK